MCDTRLGAVCGGGGVWWGRGEDGGRGMGGEEGRERREEEVVGKEEHQESGQALSRLHTGRVQTNTWRLRLRHSGWTR